MFLSGYSGRGVRIAVIDSGVHATHPHVLDPGGPGRSGGPSGSGGSRGPGELGTRTAVLDGVAIHEDGSLSNDCIDRLGHGTAVIAAIREKAPDAEILPIKVFWQHLATDVPTLVRAIDEACARGAAVINLSLGTADCRRRAQLEAALGRAAAAGAVIVSATSGDGVQWLPGSLEGAVSVRLDWTCPRDAYRLVEQNSRTIVGASGYPREIPGVPRERNLKGVSFAVANATGFVARACEASSAARLPGILDMLVAGTHGG